MLTPTPTKTLTPTPTPTATATCILYTISAGVAGATISFNGCCGNAGQTGVSIAPNSLVQRCSTTLPSLVFGTLSSLFAVGACPSCDDATVAISYRTSNGGFTTNQTGTLSYTLNGGSSVILSSAILSNKGTLYVGISSITCNYGDVLVFNFVANAGGPNLWGQGNGGSYSNIGCFGTTYTYTVPSAGSNSLFFNILSENTIWGVGC